MNFQSEILIDRQHGEPVCCYFGQAAMAFCHDSAARAAVVALPFESNRYFVVEKSSSESRGFIVRAGQSTLAGALRYMNASRVLVSEGVSKHGEGYVMDLHRDRKNATRKAYLQVHGTCEPGAPCAKCIETMEGWDGNEA